MEFLSQTYIALRGPTGAPQTAIDTVSRLSDRLSPSTLLADRRAAVLSLKGLARDCKQDVGEHALPGLIEVLQNDAELDPDMGKAVLETLDVLCETEEDPTKELGLKHTDVFLSKEQPVHHLFTLLGNTNFYIRYGTLKLLSTLLQNRRQAMQSYFLKAPSGSSSIIAILEDSREIIRNEGIVMIHSLISQSPDIQKVLAFEGAFEKLFNSITHEGGVEGGIVSQDALRCVDGLLRFNSSNQSYFRETSLPSLLCALLNFSPNLQVQDAIPQEFALQFWDQQKQVNVSLVIGIMGMLIGSKGSNTQESMVFIRCLLEMALASNAPTALKIQALRLLPTNLTFPLSEIIITPYMPVPETNGEEWDRLEPSPVVDVLMELVLHGEYNGLFSERRTKQDLELRVAALSVFENVSRKEVIRDAIMESLFPSEDMGFYGPSSDPKRPSPVSPLLHALCIPPATPLSLANVLSTHLATSLFSQLIVASPSLKSRALSIKPPVLAPVTPSAQGQFFVPADGVPLRPQDEPTVEDDELPQSLLQLLCENLSLCFLSRSRIESEDRESREWDRLIVGYLTMLSRWLWEHPSSVKEFLDGGGLGVLVEPINQTSETESIIPGLCAFLLGICYEFNRTPGEITRTTIHPIINRLGVDTLVGQMTRLREDERFKTIGPDSIVLSFPSIAAHIQPGTQPDDSVEGEIWFDWPFVDFWKSNQYTIQRAFGTDPNALSSSAAPNAESTMLIASLREVIRSQAQEIETLQQKLREASTGAEKFDELQAEIARLESAFKESEDKRKDVEKEQEDLLVLLDEVTSKRKKDKERMRGAGLEVSEDEGDEDDGDDEEQ